MATKPPIGIAPKEIWRETILMKRCHRLLDALDRYRSHLGSESITISWAYELAKTITEIQNARAKREES
jgi:hypothetical protein